MDTLRNKIYDSIFYNFIIMVINIGKNTIFFKGYINKNYKEKNEFTEEVLAVKILRSLGSWFDKLFVKIREAFYSSAIVNLISKGLKHIADNSFVGGILKEFNMIYVLALYVYVDKFVRTYIGAISSVWDELFFVIVIGWLVIRRVLGQQKYKFSTIDFPILFFALIYLALVFIKSPELDVAIEGYRAVVQYILWFYLALQLIDSKKVAYRTVWVFTVGIGGLGLHGIYQFITKAPMLGNWVDSSETLTTRAYSIIGSPNALASVFVLFIPVAFSLFIAEEDIIKKIIALMFTIFMGLGLLFTFTRGAWGAALLAVLIFLIFVGKRLILPIVAILSSLVVFIDGLWSRVSIIFTAEYQAKSAAGGRTFRWKTGLQEMANTKWVGLGIGRFGGAVATNHKLSPFYMDNYYLKTLTESGIIGFTGFMFLIFWTMRQLLLYIKGTFTTKYRIISCGMYGGMAGVLVHNIGENIFESPFMVTYFWTCAAIIVAISKLDKKEEVQ